ncbi:hypothetical protein GCM10022198_22730 [Klugiella xanthotipulae]|uniref:Alpha-tubulin suppressor-like RCC1 family protein n=1 Tax=Klugiella xanthotipulae TaxID=244735 RepID=A0A543HYD4_9MICO|nr:RCC1 domain-containing protein [Klugiella xanthotipulae]TQM63328.1 alpha-tubulin suppressor-like RCC1 family protein [Klugiella xanthotipulae]
MTQPQNASDGITNNTSGAHESREKISATEKPSGISRRTVTTAAMWSVPAVALATATPAAAASPAPNALSVAFSQEVYDMDPYGALLDATVLVQKISRAASAAAGATISFALEDIPDGEDVPDDIDEEIADATEAAGSTEMNLLFSGGRVNATGVVNASGVCTVPGIQSGGGRGVMRITATATLGALTGTAVAYIRVQTGGQGQVWAWGNASYGALGNGNKNSQPLPALVAYTANDAVDIQLSRTSAGGTLLNSSGRMFTWGYGCYGLNGQADSKNLKSYYTPTEVKTPMPMKELAGGYYNVGAISLSGAAYAWGKNLNFVCEPAGVGGERIFSPRPIHPSLSSGVTQLSLSYYQGLALKEDGTVWTWGYNYGYYGLGLGAGQPAYVKVPTKITFPVGTGKIIHISAGWACGFAVDENGSIWGWGSGAYYRLGLGGTTNYNFPQRINAPNDIGYVRINHFSYPGRSVMAIKSNGTAKYWGYNGYGNSGNGTTGSITVPTEIGITNVDRAVVGPQTTYLIRKDGTVWAAGANGYGQLGDGTKTHKRAWTKVLLPPSSKALKIGANQYTAFALTDR